VIDTHERAVIATGGSLVTEPAAYDLLLSSCTVIWLKASPQCHMQRVTAQGDLRPMANNPRALDDLRAILEARQPLYQRAHACLDTTEADNEQALAALIKIVSPAIR